MRCQLAMDVFVRAIRNYIGAFLVELGGVDVLTFSGGIGENGVSTRAAVCQGLEVFGDEPGCNANNAAARGRLSFRRGVRRFRSILCRRMRNGLWPAAAQVVGGQAVMALTISRAVVESVVRDVVTRQLASGVTGVNGKTALGTTIARGFFGAPYAFVPCGYRCACLARAMS